MEESLDSRAGSQGPGGPSPRRAGSRTRERRPGSASGDGGRTDEGTGVTDERGGRGSLQNNPTCFFSHWMHIQRFRVEFP